MRGMSGNLRQASQRGFALIVMLVILVMGSLYGIVTSLSNVTEAKLARATGTGSALAQAKEALIAYAVTYRDRNADQVFGYLPCPDTDGDGDAEASCGTAGQTVVGLLPYKTLGLEDLRDSTGGCLWYVVSSSFKNSPAGTPLNWDTQGQLAVTNADGSAQVTPNDTQGGAAAVIVAAGAPLASQSRSFDAAKVCGIANPATNQSAYLDGSYTFPSSATADAPLQLQQGTSDSTTNNDKLLPITPKELFDRIAVRADFRNLRTATIPGQINNLVDQTKFKLEKAIQDDIVGATSTSTPANQGSYTQFSGKTLGDLPTLSLDSTSDQNFFDNWRNQFRLVTCNPLSTPCLTIAGTACRAALLFVGQGTSGPRTTTQATPSTANLANYLEAAGGLGLVNSSATSFTGQTSYSAPYASVTRSPAAYSDPYGNVADRAMDVGTCLFPGSFLSFANDIASFAAGKVSAGSGSSLATVNTGAKTVVLGSSNTSGGSACVWNPTVLPMTSTLRLYFRMTWTTKGDGYALALADGATNLSPTDGSRTQVMCGANGSTTLGYSGIPSSGSVVGIQKPKLGIEFDTRYDSSRNDPYGDHSAFLYWGNSTDSSPSGSGNDDTTHYLGNGSLAVTNATWSSGTATLTTASDHGLAAGDVVLVSDIAPSGYNATYTVLASGLTSTQFKITLASDPGTFSTSGRVTPASAGLAPRNPRIASAIKTLSISSVTWSTTSCGGTPGRVSITTSTSHGLAAGQPVYITGINPQNYNGAYTISSISGTNPAIFRFCKATNPGSYASGGTVAKGTELSALSWSGGTASVTTPTSHPMTSGETATIFGVTPTVSASGAASGFNTSASLTKNGATLLSYALGSDPGGSFTTETPAGMKVVSSSDTHLPYSNAFPTGTAIHVRLDISRSYDSTNHIAVLNMKAYVGDTFPIADACDSGDMQNLSRDLADLCPNRSPTLEQASVPINALATLSAASWSSGTNTVSATTSASHGLANGAQVVISGASPAAYNGSHTITVTGSNTFTYPLTSDPGTYASGGDIEPLSTVYVGFTNARSSSGSTSPENQSVTIDNLLLRSQ